jgi:hypothetical protein
MEIVMVETEELAMLMAEVEHDLSVAIQNEYAALLDSVCENLSGLPN